MKSFYTAMAALVAQAAANSDIVTLRTTAAAYITEAEATLILPQLPAKTNGDVSMWSAIYTEQQASFLQGVTLNSPSGDFCNNGQGSWCNVAYELEGKAPNWKVTTGKGVSAGPGAAIRTHYKLNPTTGLWDQNVYINGVLKSTVSTSKNQHGQLFYISIECPSGVGTCPAHPAHTWEDVSVVLAAANPSFKHTGAWAHGATGGAMSTPDGGKTWNFTSIAVPSQKAQ